MVERLLGRCGVFRRNLRGPLLQVGSLQLFAKDGQKSLAIRKRGHAQREERAKGEERAKIPEGCMGEFLSEVPATDTEGARDVSSSLIRLPDVRGP